VSARTTGAEPRDKPDFLTVKSCSRTPFATGRVPATLCGSPGANGPVVHLAAWHEFELESERLNAPYLPAIPRDTGHRRLF